MSLDKAIKYGKEHRKPYTGSKAIDKSCRNHGGGAKYQCDWCLGNRLHHNKKRESKHREVFNEEEFN
jgi:hypothetical protein